MVGGLLEWGAPDVLAEKLQWELKTQIGENFSYLWYRFGPDNGGFLLFTSCERYTFSAVLKPESLWRSDSSTSANFSVCSSQSNSARLYLTYFLIEAGDTGNCR
ncbi:hypothetical protein MAR_019391 [Mya arenaria]|uniref:Uncharacterized protein n=1 Tax=Mya arenaria TaxID=6604 RepID=A0ABY7EHH0_MYAAR|nr:hypothetical protein MAR_019316 [Mya arenaria]WAR09433.1 hypothetical protein MAR_019391 [Mya arenaria]